MILWVDKKKETHKVHPCTWGIYNCFHMFECSEVFQTILIDLCCMYYTLQIIDWARAQVHYSIINVSIKYCVELSILYFSGNVADTTPILDTLSCRDTPPRRSGSRQTGCGAASLGGRLIM